MSRIPFVASVRLCYCDPLKGDALSESRCVSDIFIWFEVKVFMPDALPAATPPIYLGLGPAPDYATRPKRWVLPLPDKTKPEGSRWIEFRVFLLLSLAHIGFPHKAAGVVVLFILYTNEY